MIMKKQILTICLVAALVSAEQALAADDIPKPAPFARYEVMMNRSPFAVATAVAPAPVAPNFARDLYIANAARLPSEGVVTLNSSSDRNMREYLTTKGPNAHGYSIANIEWSDRVGATKVTIAKDGQFATLTFNQALLSQSLAANSAPQIQPVPRLPGQPQLPDQPGVAQQPPPGMIMPNPKPNPNVVRPAPIPTLPTPPPRVRGVIQRNPVPVPVPTPDSNEEEDE